MTDATQDDDVVVPVVLAWPYDARASVLLAGTFNNWQPQAMTPQRDRRWEARLLLHTAQTPHFYKFVVDGQWYFDVRLPTANDGFGNVNNAVDVRRVLREEAAFRADVAAAGAGARWMVRPSAQSVQQGVASVGGGVAAHYRRCSDELSVALDEACASGSDRTRVGASTDAVLRWRYVSGELVVDFSLVDAKTGAASAVRPVGAFPLRVPRPLHECGYGRDAFDDDDDFLPTLAATNARAATQRRLAEQGASLLQLPDDVLVRVFGHVLRRCTCRCHAGQIAAEPAVHALCTLELVCKRFRTPLPDVSLPEQAARNLCHVLQAAAETAAAATTTTTTQPLSSRPPSRRCWKEQLLWLDPKVAEREMRLKKQLYATAFRKSRDGSRYANDDVVRAAAVAEIKRRWPDAWDIVLARASEAPPQP